METTNTNTNTNTNTDAAARLAARRAGAAAAAAKVAAAVNATKARDAARRANHAPAVEGLKGKARTDATRSLLASDRDSMLAALEGSLVTVRLSFVTDEDGKRTGRALVQDVVTALDASGNPVRLAMTGTLRVTDTVRVSVDALTDGI